MAILCPALDNDNMKAIRTVGDANVDSDDALRYLIHPATTDNHNIAHQAIPASELPKG